MKLSQNTRRGFDHESDGVSVIYSQICIVEGRRMD